MQKINFQTRLQEIKKAPPGKKGSKRGDVLGLFFEKLKDNHLDENGEQKYYFKDGKKKKVYPMTIERLGALLAPIKSEGDLFAFYQECNQAKNFCIYFFWRYKVAKNQ